MVYSERIIAFIDILGFKNAINETIENEQYAEKVLENLRRILKIKEDKDDLGGGCDMKITTFSDSAVISISPTFPSDIVDLIMEIVFLQVGLMKDGFLLRGGITCGLVYHDGDIVFGPAMNQAYKIESEIADMPRVVVCPTVEEKYYELSQSVGNNELNFELSSFLHRFEDHETFVHMLVNPQYLLDEPDDYFSWLENIRRCVIDGLNNTEGKVLRKYQWLKRYFNSLIMDDEIPLRVPIGDFFTGDSGYRGSYKNLLINQ